MAVVIMALEPRHGGEPVDDVVNNTPKSSSVRCQITDDTSDPRVVPADPINGPVLETAVSDTWWYNVLPTGFNNCGKTATAMKSVYGAFGSARVYLPKCP